MKYIKDRLQDYLDLKGLIFRLNLEFEKIQKALDALNSTVTTSGLGGATLPTVPSGKSVLWSGEQSVTRGSVTVSFPSVGRADYIPWGYVLNSSGNMSFVTFIPTSRGVTSCQLVAKDSGVMYFFLVG